MALGPRVALAWTRPPGSDHFLLHDLLHADGALLRGFVVVGHPVPACVAHDRIGRDHRATGWTGDLGLSLRLRCFLRGRFVLETVPACVAHDRIGRDHRATGWTRHFGWPPEADSGLAATLATGFA